MKNNGYEKQPDQITEAPWASQPPLLVSSCLQELPVLDGSGTFLQKCAKKIKHVLSLFRPSLPLLPLSARQLCLVLGLAPEYGSLSPLQASSPFPREQQTAHCQLPHDPCSVITMTIAAACTLCWEKGKKTLKSGASSIVPLPALLGNCPFPCLGCHYKSRVLPHAEMSGWTFSWTVK